jgi:hypothetical protein
LLFKIYLVVNFRSKSSEIGFFDRRRTSTIGWRGQLKRGCAADVLAAAANDLADKQGAVAQKEAAVARDATRCFEQSEKIATLCRDIMQARDVRFIGLVDRTIGI